jgi:hypothetical protein
MMDVVFLGEKVAYGPSALVRHSHRRTTEEFKKQIFGYGVGFTGIFTALVFDDRRHLLEILRRVPRGVRMSVVPRVRHSPSTATSYAKWTQLVQLIGMAYGPIAFVRGAVRPRITTRR